MKNLKKTLCLVLVIAMVCSLFVSVNAAAFKDQADIDNATAAAVLNEIGVITGYTDGSFKPEGVLTRAEGATIIARMLLGDKADDQMAAGNPFDDVKATDWHAGYIAYCVAEGIAAGYGNGKFGPNDTLTVAQFGKMLLNALGYESAREGFTGADWANAVGKYINKLGLAEGANATLNAACTRQVAAQLALNTLKADLVEYATGSTTIKGGDMEITIGGSKAEAVESASDDVDNIIKDVNALTGKGILQFAERYFPELFLSETSENNNFGRPEVKVWKTRTDELGADSSDAELLKTYSGAVSRGTLYDLVGKKIVKALENGTDGSKIVLAVDGQLFDVAAGKVADVMTDKNDTKGKAITFADYAYPTGNGVVTEVYLQEDAGTYTVTIVVINTYVATVEADFEEGDEDLDITVHGVGATAGIKTATLDAEEFELTGYEEDDFVLVTIDLGEEGKDAKVATIAPAKTVSGTIDSYEKNEKSDYLNNITVGGKPYKYSKKDYSVNNKGNHLSLEPNMVGTDITLVLDAAGYVIAFADAEVAANYLYLVEIGYESSFEASKNSPIGAVYFTDGTYEEIAISKVDKDKEPEKGTPLAGWYTYAVNSEGKYVLTPVETTVGEAKTGTFQKQDRAATKVDGGVVAFVDGAKANTKTVFVVVDDEGEATIFTGYKGMANVLPKTQGDVMTVDYIFNQETGFASFVFIKSDKEINIAGSTKDISTVVFIYGEKDKYVEVPTADGEKYWKTQFALVNGVVTTIYVEDSAVSELDRGMYIGVQYNNVTGHIAGMTEVIKENDFDANATVGGKSKDAFTLTLAKADNTIVFDSGILSLGAENDYEIAEDCDIILVEKEDYTKIGMSKLTSLSTDGTATYYGVVNADGQVTALYVDYTEGV